jgi:dTDP-4-amino-4,6-dideoxygalactose transaminase
MIVTNCEAINKRNKIMLFHTINRDIWERFKTNNIFSCEDVVVAFGFICNMPDVNTVIILAQLVKEEEFRIQIQPCANI